MPVDVSPDEARGVGNALRVDWRVVPEETFRRALEVELEHSDVTHGDLDLTGRIVLGHLREFPDYYTRLAPMERRAEADWAGRPKPSPTLGGCGGRSLGTALIVVGALLIIAGVCMLLWHRSRRGRFLAAAPGTFQFWSYDPARSSSNQLDYCEVDPDACPWTRGG
ncbi:MAG: DUF5661 family protein [Gemmatimonadaceae bacterium]|jgi:hypothetical protein